MAAGDSLCLYITAEAVKRFRFNADVLGKTGIVDGSIVYGSCMRFPALHSLFGAEDRVSRIHPVSIREPAGRQSVIIKDLKIPVEQQVFIICFCAGGNGKQHNQKKCYCKQIFPLTVFQHDSSSLQ